MIRGIYCPRDRKRLAYADLDDEQLWECPDKHLWRWVYKPQESLGWSLIEEVRKQLPVVFGE